MGAAQRMIPLLAEAAAFLLPLVGEAAIAAIRDAAELTDEEHAERVERLLIRVQVHDRLAAVKEEAGRHRGAILHWRRAQRAASRADRMAK